MLSNLLPEGGAGCQLHLQPDVVDIALPPGTSWSWSLTVPNVAALVGQVLHQQMVTVELGGGGVLTSVRATNELALTFGSL